MTMIVHINNGFIFFIEKHARIKYLENQSVYVIKNNKYIFLQTIV